MIDSKRLYRLRIASGKKIKEKNYWLSKLAGEPVKSSFPIHFRRETAARQTPGEVSVEFSEKLSSLLLALSAGSDVRMYIILASGLTLLIHKYTNAGDIIVGAPIFKVTTGVEPINTVLPLRNRLEANITFKQLLLQMKQTIAEANENQNYPIEVLIDQLNMPAVDNEFPLFDAAILVENIHDKEYLRHVNLNMVFSFLRRGTRISGHVDYNPSLYDQEGVKRIVHHFQNLLHTVLRDPDLRALDIEILTEEEKKQLLYDFNDTATSYPRDKTIHELFEEQAERSPEGTALVGSWQLAVGKKERNGKTVQLTYGELNKRSNGLACYLRSKGVGPDSIVGLMADRSIEMIIAILGILKAGGAYLPIESDYPQERIDYMLADSNAALLLTSEELADVGRGKKYFAPTTCNPHLSLAYVIYTSGTSGRPKGVMVGHKNVVRLVKNTNYLQLDENHRILPTGALAFDASTFEIWGALLNGSILYLVEKEEIINPGVLKEKIETFDISTMWMTSSLFNQLSDADIGIFAGLENLLVGGEALSPVHINKLRQTFPGLNIINGYGPTENTTFSTTYAITGAGDYKESIPIGSPIANSTAYIVDKWNKLQPVGIPGELYVGGDGVSRGYLNDPELTAEKFIYRSYGTYSLYSSKKLYKTGDLARWLADGNIEFIGRIDHQVKIRGFRIECGEIESELLKHNEIKEAVVLPKEDQQGSYRYLCAYFVSGSELSTAQLREYLSKSLPDYMIPSHFVSVEKIPLTPNGKVDRKALPEPDAFRQDELTAAYRAPKNEIEKMLVNIWQDVLGVDRLGTNDNFFEIGGDSIKSIQISARMKQAGYRVEMKDIFVNPFISRLAAKVKKLERIADQSIITGTVPLTPIQEWFFENKPVDRHHFNQAVMLYSQEEFEKDTIAAIFGKIQEHHDALRMTYTEEDGEIVQTNRGPDYPLSLEVYDLRGQAHANEELEARANEIQAGINLETGPLMKLGLFHLDDGDRLLIVIHHLVIDGVSWRILFEDIETLVQRYKKREQFVLPLKTDSFKTWSEKLCGYADSEAFLKEKNYWAELELTDVPGIKKDCETGNDGNYVKDAEDVSIHLNVEETDRLLTRSNEAFAAEINDILLTALGLSFKKSFGMEKVLVALEGHGREEILAGVDVSRTVGWFTSMYPVLLDFSYEPDLARQLKEVKERLRQVPARGIGYGILRYLTADRYKEGLDFHLKPRVSFNYLGQFDAEVEQMSFGIARESAGHMQSPDNQRDYDLDVSGMITARQLVITIVYNKNHYKPETINHLLDNFKGALKEIITYCSSRKQRELTPADLTYKKLSIDQLDGLAEQYVIEDIYPLSPMQEGMYFHYLYDKSSFAYFEQTSYRFNGDIEIKWVERSLSELCKRYDVLRTNFIETGGHVLQLVRKERAGDFYYEDISGRKDKFDYLLNYKKRDKEKSFDLSKDALMRVAILKLGDSEYEFTWSFHHIIIDGWCIGILISEFFQLYHNFRENRTVGLPAVKPYRAYIAWLERQDKQASAKYWREYLHHYEETAAVPPLSSYKGGESAYKEENVVFLLDKEKTIRLNRLAGKKNVTLNTIIQAAWGILLGYYNGKDDVVFGAVVSGRPAEIEGVESMVGLFINTVPVRIRYNGDTRVGDLLASVQSAAIESEPHHYYPLTEIQANTALKQRLLDHILAFENYPIAEQVTGIAGGSKEKNTSPALKISNIEIFEQTTYNFNVIIGPGDRLTIKFSYNSNAYDRDFVRGIADHITRLLDQLAMDESVTIRRLTLLSDAEKRRLLYDFNDTESGYPRDKTIHELFTEQAVRRPDRIAVTGAAQTQITYGELNKRSDRLAGYLQSKGVGPDSIVGIMVERSIEMIIGIMGILKGGGAYMPIELGYPQERIDYMLSDSNALLLLTSEELADVGRGKKYFAPTTCNPHLSLAYVIYTSGTTGKPKGVLTTHYNVTRVVRDTNYIEIEPGDRILQLSNYAFDGSVFDIYGALLNGSALVMIAKDDVLAVDRLAEVIEREAITVFFVTTALFNTLVELDIGCLAGVRKVLFGGERVSVEHCRKALEYLGNDRITHVYGPTETTVYATYYFIDNIAERAGTIPIGKPISNTTAYILDRYFRPVPVGASGEIYIGGTGTARGYLNSPELTAEKFLTYSLYFSKKLYKTGDLARWLADGNIEFIGRIDQQVKIRGFRIELGEIESQLLTHDEIKEAVVLPKQDQQGSYRYLCAYFVSGSELSGARLREYLSKSLPDYMIPSYFVPIEKIPLTPNGKVDRKALPEPETVVRDGLAAAYQAPQSQVEKILVKIWQNVLGVEKIGINDNFFEIGGDSIKSIQIGSRLKQAGYKVEMKDIFANPIISRLAAKVKKLERIADQSVITGTVPLTPIQEWFFENNTKDRHHFNHTVMLHPAERFEKDAITAIFTKIQEHHDALRMRYGDEDGEVVQTINGLDHPLCLEVYDLRGQAHASEELEARANEIQAGINLVTGPLMKLGLFHLEDGDRLLIAIHHLVIDGVSWRILFEDIETLMRQHKNGEPLILPLKTDSFKTWSEKLRQYAAGQSLLKEKNFWAEPDAVEVPGLKKDFEIDDNTNYVKDAGHLFVSLGVEETGRLLTRSNEAFGTEINDLLLTALGLSIKKSLGVEKILVALEGHGREEILGGVDVSRTVGWFTSLYPVLLDFSHEPGLARRIIEVKERLRQIPDRGIGYGILRYLTPKHLKKGLDFHLKPRVSFNYLGQFDADLEQMPFTIAKESAGDSQSLNGQRVYDLDVSGMITDKQLVITVIYNKNHFNPETITHLLDNFKGALKEIITYCSSRKQRELTPGDLTYKKLSIDELDDLKAQYVIEDIYPLSPMQEGMYFHYLYDRSSHAYFEQSSYRFCGDLRIEGVEKSLNELFKRHEILRTNFIRTESDVLQVVQKERAIDFYYEDISHRSDKFDYLAGYKETDKERSFDLSKDALMRVSVIRLGDREYEFTWSFHHIIMDGWCISILIPEYFELYNSYRENRASRLPGVTPYRDYISWLERQDREISGTYWREYLHRYEETAGIPGLNSYKSSEPDYKQDNIVFLLDEEKTAGLTRLAGKKNVTLNTIIQSVWGILLGYYNRKDDVVFGAVVSGRPAEIDGVESMVGLFINTVPVRIKYHGDTKINGLLAAVQESALESEPHHYYPLAKIQSDSQLKQNLLDHILAFENYPLSQQIETVGDAADQKIKISNVETFEQTNYDFNIIICPGGRLSIKFSYNGNVYERSFVERIADHMTRLLDQVLTEEAVTIGQLTLLSDAEKRQLLYDFNDTESGYPRDKTIHELFAEQAIRRPDRVAVTGAAQTQITYGELNKRSDGLAHLLQGKGVGTDTIVGIMVRQSIELIIGILGILKAGAAYLPIDPGYPQERIDYMLNDSNAAILLEKSEIAQSPISKHETNPNDQNSNDQNKKNPKSLGHDVLVLNFEHLNFEFVSNFEFRASNLNSSDLAYIIYTSGTTGKPKGVTVEHRSLINLCCWHIEYYDVTASDHATKYAGIGFDASVWEIFPYLIKGASLYIIDDALKLDIEKLNRFYERHNITIGFLPTQLCEQFMEIENRSLRKLLTGGDKLRAFKKNQYDLYNNYGPTENSVVSTSCLVEKHEANIPIGKPIANNRIYIFDRNYLHLQPVGVVGELCIGGDGLARGYLNSPEFTAEKFRNYRSYRTHRTYSLYFSKKIYKTGDLARWLPDGNIEFFGRADQQVKIRGFRIELGEIESQLLGHEKIKEAVVVSGEDKGGGHRNLCAYFVSERDCQIAELREYLSKSLPDYMIPSHFLQIEKIPLTPNGKVDRKALPEPGFTAGDNYVAPGEEIEKELVDIWSGVLGIKQEVIGIEDNFFELGGHSLKATLLVTKINKSFRVNVPLAEVFEKPTVEEMAKYIKGLQRIAYVSIELAEEKEYYALSSAQKRLYILQNLAPGNISYNMPAVVRLEGELDKDHLQKVFQELIKRHGSLRSSFDMVDNIPIQKLNDEVRFEVEYCEVEGFVRPFDLSQVPQLRVGLKKVDRENHVLMMDMHHIITDGASMGVFTGEFMSLYGGIELESLRIQYHDYSEWQNREEYRETLRQQEDYWLNQFGGEVPVLNLPLDYARPPLQSFEGNTLPFTIGEDDTGGLRSLAKKTETTLYMLLLSIYSILLAKLSGQEDIIVGTPIAGRRHEDLLPVMGMFVNTLVLRNFPGGEKSFSQFLEDVKKRTLSAYENQEYPFEELVEKAAVNRDTSRNPLFDTIFALQNVDIPEIEIPGLKLRPYDYENKISKFDITLQGYEAGQTLIFTIEYCTKLFKEKTMRQLFNRFSDLVKQVCRNPGIRISEIDILTEEEKHRLLYDFNDTARPYPKDKTIHELFAEQAYRSPEGTALVGNGQLAVGKKEKIHITYGVLNEKSDQLAHLLQVRGVSANDIVALMFDRCIEMVIGMMAVLKAGGAYLPVDANYPQDRIDYMLKDSSAKILLSELSMGIEAVKPGELSKEIPTHPTHPCYVIYTSGTTGKPKGVVVPHRGLVNFIYSMYADYGNDFGPADNCLSLTNFSFDVSVCEIFMPLVFGSGIVVLAGEKIFDPGELAKAVVEESITFAYLPPGLLMNVFENLKSYGGRLELNKMLVGVEPIKDNVLEAYLTLNPSLRIVNGYGPTEATICAAAYRYHSHEAEGRRVPIGSPLANDAVFLLDKSGRLVPVGVPGELCIGGDGLASGYLNNPELTGEKFQITNKCETDGNALQNDPLNEKLLRGVQGGGFLEKNPPGRRRLYKTGDLAKWLADGNLLFIGRVDRQVKVRGFRMELGEIETQLLGHEEIKEAVVVLREDTRGVQRYLCAYFVCGRKLSTLELREYLSRNLPDYMIPSYFVQVEKVPLTPNGKVDRKALPVPETFELHMKEEYAAPGTDMEKLIADTWKEVLKYEKIGIDDNFFDIGGNSLNVLQVINKLNEVLENKISVIEMFQHSTIRSLARFLSQRQVGLDEPGKKKRAEMLQKGKSDRHQRYQKRKQIKEKQSK